MPPHQPFSTPDDEAPPRWQTFVVRLWPDRARGHVQHVGSRRGLFCSGPQRLRQFIEEYLNDDARAHRS